MRPYRYEHCDTYFQQYTQKELLIRQSHGKFLNPKEKEIVKNYAQNKRKQKRHS